MSTRRLEVTETDELAHALDAAAACQPGLSRSELLVDLALLGHREAQARREKRLAALREHSGTLTGVYSPGDLAELRADWPD